MLENIDREKHATTFYSAVQKDAVAVSQCQPILGQSQQRENKLIPQGYFVGGPCTEQFGNLHRDRDKCDP